MPKRGAIPQPEVYLLKPTFVMRVCPACAMNAAWKYDKRGRPFHYCPHCGYRFFVYNLAGMIGLELQHQNILRSGIARWRQVVQQRVARQIQKEGITGNGRR